MWGGASRYLVLANMLAGSTINPFDSAETKALSRHPEIVAFTELVAAYDARDIPRFEALIRDNYAAIMGDPFIKAYIDDLLGSLRTSVLLLALQPYTRIALPFLSQVRLPSLLFFLFFFLFFSFLVSFFFL